MKKKLTAILILMLAAMLMLAACGETEYGIHRDGDKIQIVLPNLNKASKIPAAVFDEALFSEYTIVRPDLADDTEVGATLLFRNTLKELGINVNLTTDWVKRGEEAPTGTKEILIGETNRIESPKSNEIRKNEYLISFENNRLVICGGSPEATMRAVECFVEYFIDRETGEVLIPDGKEYLYSEGSVAESFMLNGIPLQNYQVECAFSASESKDIVVQYISDITGFYPPEESEYKLIIDSKAETDTCSIHADGNNIYISASELIGPTMAARYFTEQLTELSGVKDGKLSQKLKLNISDKLVRTADEFRAQEPYLIYVAADGNDENDGSKSSPLATLDAARLRVQDVKKTTSAPIKVVFTAGDYYFDESVIFTNKDSGSELSPVTYCAEEGAEVNFYGGVKIDPSRVTKAQDQSIVDRVIDKDAASRLMQIDLNGIIEEFPKEYSFGNTENKEQMPITVYINESALERSRWPNDGIDNEYVKTTKAVDNADGTKKISYGEDVTNRIKQWNEAAADDLYIFGFLAYDWFNEVHEIAKLNREESNFQINGAITVAYWEKFAGNKRFYFFNLPEEIDAPGESYIDRENLIIYFLPEDNYDANEIYISTLTSYTIDLQSAEHLVFDGFNFMYSRNRAIGGSGNYITISNSVIAHTSYDALSLSGTHITLSGNHVYDTSAGGVRLSGGDRKTLTQSYNVIDNNEIHDINRNQESYCPGISASSFGMLITHNKLYNSVHEMMSIGSNDIIVEYNEFFNCVTDSSDMGAIYLGRNPSQMGTVIRYNYFHDIGGQYSDGNGQQAIFVDDGHNGVEVYGNVFYKATTENYAIKSNGAQFSRMVGNIFIDMPYAFGVNGWINDNTEVKSNRWFLWIYDRVESSNHGIIDKLKAVDFDSPLWREHYEGTIWGQLYDYIDSKRIEEYAELSLKEMEELAMKYAPVKSNVVSENVMVNINKGNEYPCGGSGKATAENNYITMDYDIFTDYGTDFTLTDEALAEIRKLIPDFEQPPFYEMGLRK